ncbi:hypothetical protein [Paenibacillus mucilaginosus]|uniref:Uncharacterized protein n=3 Tax=Paenibacillus mucilaginosus TaxID=61624 RepID=H6NJR2_9BACL|nr:hypothetical protein [Paenibacillus mucilaginosus]AEI41707.1 hypothetical protein KNP414_03149 [Paenibacillus mucilaginosus KNP414]AFC30216.1 hypothetical protein PM3016_3373 [Paenibacillus mucilaginosus 3016]AFH62490.1 hypothetical protein B2K_17480 [Paenibacillus mucilaginosus K02]MCG7214399.1 hypothetical protein [Paenibacillus mucilaginosus]WDM30685.1 hypothetical protein KCX80_16670 [Paenibacillus mucilaginosus]
MSSEKYIVQVELLVDSSPAYLQEKVNAFLSKIPGQHIVDIKGWSTGDDFSDSPVNSYDVILVSYKKFT